MNKMTNVAYELAQDIYAVAGDVEKLHNNYDNHHISEQVYYKKLYVHSCEASCLDHIVNVVKDHGYKFVRYAKELELLQLVLDDIAQNLNLQNMNSLNMLDMKRLVQLTRKYEEYVPCDDIEEEFSI